MGNEALNSAINFIDTKVPPLRTVFQDDYNEKKVDYTDAIKVVSQGGSPFLVSSHMHA
jgi:hypothetical protein